MVRRGSLGRAVRRGDLWLAEVGRKKRPVLVFTRSEVLDVRTLVTVAEVTTSIRGLAAEVVVDDAELGLDQPSAVDCDAVHTVTQASLTTRIGQLGDDTMREVCAALGYALGC